MGREKSKYMLPFRVKYHVHFLVCSFLPQNPLVKKKKREKKSHISDCKAIFLQKGTSKNKYHSIYQDEQFGTCCDCKKHPCHMFYFFLIFQRSFMHKSEFLDENKNIFLKLTSSKSEFPLLPYSALNIYFTKQATDKYSVMCSYSGGTILDDRSDLLGTQSYARRTQCSPLAIQTFPTHITFRCLDFICNPLY